MDLLRPLSKHILIPLYDIKEGQRTSSQYRDAVASQFYTEEKIRELQLSRVIDLVSYAYQHCEFYRDRFDECNITPKSISSLDDMAKIPILTKDDIRSNVDRIISSEFNKEDMVYKRTGGSTSVPLKLYVDRKAHVLKKAATQRHDSWAGFERGDKVAAIWGDTDKQYSFRGRLFNALIARVIYLDTLNMGYRNNMQFVEKVRKTKPAILTGHAHSLFEFSRFLIEHKIQDLSFRGIISTAEMLYESERKTIESVFGNVLFNRYGCEELSIIASECEAHEGLHVNAEGLYVEVLGGDADTPGKLVITDLSNRGMPFIRYEIGDMATTQPGPCDCGRGLPRLGKIYGRTSDFLYTPEGGKVSGISILDTFTIHIPGVKQVQIIQDTIDELTFKIVKDADFNETSRMNLDVNVAKYFGSTMKYKIEFVPSIPQTARGKYRFSICNIVFPLNGKHPTNI